MLSYDKWKMLNESLGRATLGISQRPSLGLISNMRVPVQQEGWNEDDGEPESEMSDHPVDMGDYDDETGGDEMPAHKKHLSHMDGDDSDDFGDEEDGVPEDGDDEVSDDAETGPSMDDSSDEDDSDDDDDFGDDEDDVEEDDDEFEDSDGDEVDVHAMDKHGEDGDEEEMEVSEKPAMGESKKLPKHMLSEKDWWASVKNMVGQVQPNGAIKNESLLLTLDEPLDVPPTNSQEFTGIIKNIVDKFEINKGKLDTATKAKNIGLLEYFVKTLARSLHHEKGVTYASIKNMLRKFIDSLPDEEEDKKDQTANPLS